MILYRFKIEMVVKNGIIRFIGTKYLELIKKEESGKVKPSAQEGLRRTHRMLIKSGILS